MRNIIADVKTWISAHVTLYGKITMDAFGSDVESLMIRGDPSTVREVPYIDGSCIGLQQASIYARSKNPATAIAALQAIGKAVELKDIPLTDVVTVTVTQLTDPNMVSKEDTGVFVYTMALNISYERSL